MGRRGPILVVARGCGTFLLLNRFTTPPLLSAAAIALGFGVSCFIGVPGHEYAIFTYPALAIAFAGPIALSQRTTMVRSSNPVRLWPTSRLRSVSSITA